MERVFSILQSWLEKRLGEPAQFRTRLPFGQLINQLKMNRWLDFFSTSQENTSCKELEDHAEAL
jgi:hypothetical protein